MAALLRQLTFSLQPISCVATTYVHILMHTRTRCRQIAIRSSFARFRIQIVGRFCFTISEKAKGEKNINKERLGNDSSRSRLRKEKKFAYHNELVCCVPRTNQRVFRKRVGIGCGYTKFDYHYDDCERLRAGPRSIQLRQRGLALSGSRRKYSDGASEWDGGDGKAKGGERARASLPAPKIQHQLYKCKMQMQMHAPYM